MQQLKVKWLVEGFIFSTLTLRKTSDLLIEDFKRRSQFVSAQVLNAIDMLEIDNCGQSITEILTLYQNVVLAEKQNTLNLYNEVVKEIESSLQSESSKRTFRESIENLTKLRILKDNSAIELRCKAILGTPKNKSQALLLSPNISGIGVDLRTLFDKIHRKFKGQ